MDQCVLLARSMMLSALRVPPKGMEFGIQQYSLFNAQAGGHHVPYWGMNRHNVPARSMVPPFVLRGSPVVFRYCFEHSRGPDLGMDSDLVR